MDPRQRLGFARVDGLYAGVSVWTGYELGVEHSWQPEVVGVDRFPSNQLFGIYLDDPLPDDAKFLVRDAFRMLRHPEHFIQGVVCHGSLSFPFFDHALDRFLLLDVTGTPAEHRAESVLDFIVRGIGVFVQQ